MNAENQSGEPRARNLQATQNQPDQHRIGRLKQNIERVITERVVPEQMVLDPERRVRDWKVICRCPPDQISIKPENVRSNGLEVMSCSSSHTKQHATRATRRATPRQRLCGRRHQPPTTGLVAFQLRLHESEN